MPTIDHVALMSALLKAIGADLTGRRVVMAESFKPLLEATEGYTDLRIMDAVEYRVGVRLGMVSVAMNDAELGRVKAEVKKRIAEAVFGEFRLPLIEAITDVRAGSRDAAINKIGAVLDVMFQV